ncbi:uncharacterized protein LOC111259656 [Varroa jacobsoni]|uniref:Uncharacterized protein n=1 Tax=Varroa destructor TaxID=109461 RepID=A0A7M7MEV7_VARDE|nr:uncharacterized protein LOC111254648 [Varroa destructor]XP_022687565.1 uncharacterized protein LOC111259656 [Varroa jacobsoni]
MEIFGGLDDDIFVQKKPQREVDSSVLLLEAEPGWFHNESAPEGLELLRLKYLADRFYKEKRYAEAAWTYISAIEICPPKNLGFLRDIMDGATRSLIHSSRLSGIQNDTIYKQALERIHMLEEIVTCEDHRFSVAATLWLAAGGLKDLHILIESEPQSASLWRTLGRRYQADGKELLALCCFVKAACYFRNSVHECKDRFREENLAAAEDIKNQIVEISAALPQSALNIVDRINSFYASLADTKREPGKPFEDYWFPPECL